MNLLVSTEAWVCEETAGCREGTFEQFSKLKSMNEYKLVLVAFMSHKDKKYYLKSKEFSEEKLFAGQPADIARYFNFRAFKTIEPGETARPTHIRANTLEYFKKDHSSCCHLKLISRMIST